MPSYDPYTHAHTLGVDIVWGTPGHGMLGRYDHASRTITLREGMRTRQERSVLATNSCTPCAETSTTPGMHPTVHAVSAAVTCWPQKNLIDPGDLRRAAAFYPDNLPALAYELDVTEELLVIYLDAHPLTVAQA